MKFQDRYDSLFRYYAETRALPWRVLKALAMAESSLRPNVVSSKGAQGLAGFMQATAVWMGVKDPFNPEMAIEGMAKYVGQIFWNCAVLLEGLDATRPFVWRCTIASYNCGWGYVREALMTMKRDHRPFTWDVFSRYLAVVEYKGKRPYWRESVAEAVRVIPDEAPADLLSLA